MALRAEGRKADAALFRIPTRAWVVAALAVLASYAALALTDGPVIESGGICKGCRLVLYPRFWIAVGTFVSGSALSIWIGALPRERVAGWTGVVAAAWCAAPLLLVGISVARGLTPFDWFAVLGLVLLPTLWIAQLPLGVVAASVSSPFRPRMPMAVPTHDDRPRWLQDIDATIALLDDDDDALAESEQQRVAELAFALGNDRRVPTAVRDHADRMRTIMASALEGRALRNALLVELRAAADAGARDPYREC